MTRQFGGGTLVAAVVGRNTAAYRDGALRFPDGTIRAELAWNHQPFAEMDGALVTGPATTVQIMVEDSNRFASTGGWRFGRFIDGKPVDQAQRETFFACHHACAKGHDFVFTRHAH